MFSDRFLTTVPSEQGLQFTMSQPCPQAAQADFGNSFVIEAGAENRRERLLAAVLAIAGLTLFLIAGVLSPYEPDGTRKELGTHQQLGLPPCGFLTVFQVPCPGCGMTTAFSLVVRGDLSGGWRANAAGVLIAVVTFVSTLLFTVIAVRGRRSGLWTDDVIKYAVAIAAIAATSRWLFVVGPMLFSFTN